MVLLLGEHLHDYLPVGRSRNNNADQHTEDGDDGESLECRQVHDCQREHCYEDRCSGDYDDTERTGQPFQVKVWRGHLPFVEDLIGDHDKLVDSRTRTAIRPAIVGRSIWNRIKAMNPSRMTTSDILISTIGRTMLDSR